MRTSKLEPPCQNWFITRWVYPFVSANPRKSWRDQSPGAHLQDLGGLLIDEEVIQSIPQTVVPLSILHTNWLMITMLAHFSCLINIFFLSLSILILSYFFFYWFQGATMQARAFGSNMKRLKDSWLKGRSTPCLISQYAQESMSPWPIETPWWFTGAYKIIYIYTLYEMSWFPANST